MGILHNSQPRSCIERIFVLGNSVNLVAGKNVHLRYENVLKNYVRDDKLTKDFFDECCRIQPTFVHYALVELFEDVMAYYTTNYDYALEIAIKHKNGENLIPVKHIHGEAQKPESCVFFEQDYERALNNICQEDWYADFHRSEIHFFGLALRKEERVIYHILRERRDKIEKLPDFSYSEEVKPVYAWLTYEEQEKQATEELATYLRTLSVVPILIPVYEKDYISAWEYLLGRFMLQCKKIHVSKAESVILKSGKTPQQATRGLNVSYSSTPSLKYPERVHFKLQKSTITKCAEDTFWYFYCEIDKMDYIWKFPMEELQKILKISAYPTRLNLYVNYVTGELYCAQTPNNIASVYKTVCTRVCSAVAFDDDLNKTINCYG